VFSALKERVCALFFCVSTFVNAVRDAGSVMLLRNYITYKFLPPFLLLP